MHIPINRIKRKVCVFLNKEDEEINDLKTEVGEDYTKYGEFVSSYFAWISLPKQKEKAEELQRMTKEDKKRRKNKK